MAIGDIFLNRLPCLSDPAKRSSLCLKLALISIHLIYLGVLLLFDFNHYISIAHQHPWSVALYLLLFIATLLHYLLTSASSPGYLVDAMSSINHNPNPNGDLVITLDNNPMSQTRNATSWTKLVMQMYPPGSSMRQYTCTYCNILQPPRAKHCHDCDKCVLQFDHHCVWLGTCIGQGNHCRFWWYICAETVLCLWTGILYITYLKANISRSWWMSAVMIVLLISLSISLVFLVLLLMFHSYLVLTNQTTYELVRRRRIPYLRGIPERIYPFSKGMCRNLYNFCCAGSSVFQLEPLPTAQEIEIKSRPLACSDVLCCRCC